MGRHVSTTYSSSSSDHREYVTKNYELPGPTKNYETLKSEPPLVAEGDIGNNDFGIISNSTPHVSLHILVFLFLFLNMF